MKIIRIITIIILVITLATGCSTPIDKSTNEDSIDQLTADNVETLIEEDEVLSSVQLTTDIFEYDDDLNQDVDIENGISIEVGDGDTYIDEAGTYILSGKTDNGQIIVEVEGGVVNLVLNGIDITSVNSSPIYIVEAEKTIITVVEGTTNRVSDGSDYVYENSEDNEPNATIFSHDDLTINGSGILIVNGNYNNGISSKDDLKIIDSQIFITAIDDGILGRDSVIIKNANIEVDVDGDGIKSTNDEALDKGYIGVESGVLSIDAGSDALQAETTILIKDGIFTLNSIDDAIHSNAAVNIMEGSFTISSEDDGIHADELIKISGGQIDINNSYEGIESAIISILGGVINIVATDDGINVAGGNDQSAPGGRSFNDEFSDSGNYQLIISDGDINVNSQGDGLDANGSIYMTGGNVIVNGPTNNGNGAIDYDGAFEISGGLLIAVGSSGMVQAPDDNSSQYSIAKTYTSVIAEGTKVTLKEGDTVIATITPTKIFQSIVISSPNITDGQTYILETGDIESEEITIESIVTWSGEGAQFGQPGGGRNRPGGTVPEGEFVKPEGEFTPPEGEIKSPDDIIRE